MRAAVNFCSLNYIIFTLILSINTLCCEEIDVSKKLVRIRKLYSKASKNFVQLGSPISRIAGSSAKGGQFPWQAHLILDGEYACGGSLISPEWILTAAHCVYQVTNFTIILGAVSIENDKKLEGVQIFETQTKFVHEKFEEFSLNDDIALLKLPAKVNTGTFVSTIRLPRLSEAKRKFDGVEGIVSGWGQTGDTKPPSDKLNFVKRRVVNNKECLKAYNKIIVTPAVLCIRNGDKKGTCNGDSGGPFVYVEKDKIHTQIGLVSFGSLDSCFKQPSGFTRVASYLQWIAEKTGLTLRN